MKISTIEGKKKARLIFFSRAFGLIIKLIKQRNYWLPL